jgi:hypothetical protein
VNWFWINVLLMAVISVAVIGIPLWLVLTRPDFGPEPAGAADTPVQVTDPGAPERTGQSSPGVLAGIGAQQV